MSAAALGGHRFPLQTAERSFVVVKARIPNPVPNTMPAPPTPNAMPAGHMLPPWLGLSSPDTADPDDGLNFRVTSNFSPSATDAFFFIDSNLSALASIS